MFLCCFSLKAGRKDLTNRPKQHRNIFSNHTGRLAKFGWILTYLKISVEKIWVHVDWAQTRPSLSSAPTQSVLRSIVAPDDAHGSTSDQPRVQSQTNARPLPRFPSDGSHSLPIDVIHLPVTSFTCQWRLHFPVTLRTAGRQSTLARTSLVEISTIHCTFLTPGPPLPVDLFFSLSIATSASPQGQLPTHVNFGGNCRTGCCRCRTLVPLSFVFVVVVVFGRT